MNSVRSKLEFADGAFMGSGAPFDGGDRLANFTMRLEVPQEQNIVSQVADVDCAVHLGTDHARLCQDH